MLFTNSREMIHRFKRTLSVLAGLLILVSSCADERTQVKEQSTATKDLKITQKDIANIQITEYVLSDLATKKVEDWLKFSELSSQIEMLQKGDLSFFQADKTILETFLKDLIAGIPEALNEPSINVRLNVLATASLKLEGISNLENLDKDTVREYVKDILISYNNLIFQINKKLEKDSQNIKKPQ